MMKKRYALVVSLLVATLVLSACGGKSTDSTNNASNKPQSTQTAVTDYSDALLGTTWKDDNAVIRFTDEPFKGEAGGPLKNPLGDAYMLKGTSNGESKDTGWLATSKCPNGVFSNYHYDLDGWQNCPVGQGTLILNLSETDDDPVHLKNASIYKLTFEGEDKMQLQYLYDTDSSTGDNDYYFRDLGLEDEQHLNNKTMTFAKVR